MDLPTGEPERRGRVRASVHGAWAYDNQNYGYEFTTPDVFCDDEFQRRRIWQINDIVAVHHSGSWHEWSSGPWSTYYLLIALEEELESLGVSVDLSRWKGGRGFPSRDDLVALLRPDLTPAERRLWVRFASNVNRSDQVAADDAWLVIPEDWREGVPGEVLTLVDGEEFLLGEIPDRSWFGWPGNWLDQTLSWAEHGVGGVGPPEAHIRDLPPDLQADRACRLGCHLVGPMNDIGASMDAWAVRLAGQGILVEPVTRWPAYRSDDAYRLERPLMAVDRTALSAELAQSLARVVIDAYAASRELADELHRLAGTRRPPGERAYSRLHVRCEALVAAASDLYSWPLRSDPPLRVSG